LTLPGGSRKAPRIHQVELSWTVMSPRSREEREEQMSKEKGIRGRIVVLSDYRTRCDVCNILIDGIKLV
jgi:hypothetical protein